ncbi:MAG: hypothetical protein R3C99_01435 [Pirellulaceae bacterium]
MASDIFTQFMAIVGSLVCCGSLVVFTMIMLLLSGKRRRKP